MNTMTHVDSTDTGTPTLSRRQVLLGMGAVAMLGAVGNVSATSHTSGLVKTAHGCVDTGHACLNHCFDMFKAGDTSLAQCAVLVNETIATCNAIAQLALSNSKHLKSFAGACVGQCQDCETECRKHEKHPVCKDMAEACAAFIAEAKKAAA